MTVERAKNPLKTWEVTKLRRPPPRSFFFMKRLFSNMTAFPDFCVFVLFFVCQLFFWWSFFFAKQKTEEFPGFFVVWKILGRLASRIHHPVTWRNPGPVYGLSFDTTSRGRGWKGKNLRPQELVKCESCRFWRFWIRISWWVFWQFFQAIQATKRHL